MSRASPPRTAARSAAPAGRDLLLRLGRAQRLRLAIGEGTKALAPVTVSMGGITFASPPGSVNEALHLANELMYQVKINRQSPLPIAEVFARWNWRRRLVSKWCQTQGRQGVQRDDSQFQASRQTEVRPPVSHEVFKARGQAPRSGQQALRKPYRPSS